MSPVAATAARGYVNDHNYALVLFDKVGSGDEGEDRQRIQTAVERDLGRSGWEDRSKAIVIEPELETWVWSTSANVGKILGWDEGTSARQKIIKGLTLSENTDNVVIEDWDEKAVSGRFAPRSRRFQRFFASKA